MHIKVTNRSTISIVMSIGCVINSIPIEYVKVTTILNAQYISAKMQLTNLKDFSFVIPPHYKHT